MGKVVTKRLTFYASDWTGKLNVPEGFNSSNQNSFRAVVFVCIYEFFFSFNQHQ